MRFEGEARGPNTEGSYWLRQLPSDVIIDRHTRHVVGGIVNLETTMNGKSKFRNILMMNTSFNNREIICLKLFIH